MSLNLVLDYESSALAAPQSFRDAMQTAANILDATIKDNITVNIQVGYGDYYNNVNTDLWTTAEDGDEGTFDLGRYTSPGNHLFSSGSTAPAAYFSIDGGVTKLADYGQNSDPSDFLNSGVQGPNDPYNEFYSGSTVQALSTVDKQLLDALGFNVSTNAPGGPPAATSSIVASSPTVTADGTSTTTLTVTVEDAHGNAVAGTGVTLSGSGSSNTFGAVSGTTNANGVFTTTLASALVQNETITATEGSVQEQTSVSFVAGGPSATNSSIVASSPTVTADGVSTTLLTVTVEDAHGHTVAGTAVTLSGSGSSNSFGTISGTTNANGVFTTTLASTQAQNETITATEGSVQEHTSVSFVPTAILTQIGNNYYLDGGSGPELKFGGAAYVAGEWGAWMPYTEVKTATGYDVAWTAGAGHYTVWSADSNGNWVQDLIHDVPGGNTAFESIETTFKQDLNGDGVIGIPTATTHTTTITNPTPPRNNFY